MISFFRPPPLYVIFCTTLVPTCLKNSLKWWWRMESDLKCFIRIRAISSFVKLEGFLKDALEWEFEFLSLDKWIEKVWKEGVVKWIFLYRKWPKFLVILKGGLPGILNYFFKKSSQFFVPFGILSSFFSATKSSPKATLRGAVKILLHVLQHWRKMTNHNFMTTLWTIKCEECVWRAENEVLCSKSILHFSASSLKVKSFAFCCFWTSIVGLA